MIVDIPAAVQIGDENCCGTITQRVFSHRRRITISWTRDNPMAGINRVGHDASWRCCYVYDEKVCQTGVAFFE